MEPFWGKEYNQTIGEGDSVRIRQKEVFERFTRKASLPSNHQSIRCEDLDKLDQPNPIYSFLLAVLTLS